MPTIKSKKTKNTPNEVTEDTIENVKEICYETNLLFLTSNKFAQHVDKINHKTKMGLKNIKQFFENLPLSDELNIDEENTNPMEHYLGDRSNYTLPLELENRYSKPLASLTNMLPFQVKDSLYKEKKSDKKRKCEESQLHQNMKQVKITSQ